MTPTPTRSPWRVLGLLAAALLVPSADAAAQQLRVGRLDRNPPQVLEAMAASGALVTTGSPFGASAQGQASLRGGAPATGTPPIPKLPAIAGGTDSDGDGLTDQEELAGWDIVIDENGYGTEALGTLLTIKHVTSNHLVADSDGDGLTDDEEWAIGSDPKKVDTDGDLLDDEVEWNTWFTSTNSVDSDADARGPDGDLPPNVSLFDGYELDSSTPRTSPTLDDTDGDGRTDFEEFDHPLFDPLLAELPTAAITVEGTMDVRLDVEYAESVVQEQAYETSFSLSSTVTKGSEKTSSESKTKGWSKEFSVGLEESVSVEAGAPPSATGEVTASQEYTQGSHGEVTKEKSFTVSTETAKTSEQTSSQYQSDSTAYTETAATGSITLPIRIENDSAFAYTLTNLGVTLLAFDPDPTGLGPGVYRSMGTIVPDLESVTLAPGEVTPILNLDSGDLNADVVKGFLANPATLILQPSIFDMQNAEGVDFDFITEHTFTQTALVEIDHGDGNVDIYRVATNVDREGFEYRGITMATVMQDVLGIPYTVEVRTEDDGSAIVGTDADGNSGDVKVLTEIDGLASIYDDTPGSESVTAFWSVATDADLSHALVGTYLDTPHTDFESIHLFAGDSIRLIYDKDEDGDGVWASQERELGTSDLDADTDGDLVSDRKEAIEGWTNQFNGETVYSDPRNPDTDFDGWSDDQERSAGTDPQNPDTDGDGLIDSVDPEPKSAGVILHVVPDTMAAGGQDGFSWSTAMTLLEAVAYATTANTDGQVDDVVAMWVHQGAYDVAGTVIDMPPGNVAVLGGFLVGDLKPGDRDPDPLTNQTTFVSSVDGSQWLRWKNGELPGEAAGTLDGFTLTGAGATTPRVLNVNEGVVTLRNILAVDNDTNFGVVGIFDDGSVVAEGCTFLLNTAGVSGGAVFDGGSERSTFTDCEFSLNNAHDNGGAVYRDQPETVSAGTAGPRFERCTFFSNQVFWTDSTGKLQKGGGAVHTDDGGTFLDCDFFGNQTQSTLADSDFKYGTNSLRGGAIRYDGEGLYDTDLSLINCRFFENVSGQGGAVYVHNIGDSTYERTLNIINCTLVRNRALKEKVATASERASGGIQVNSNNGASSNGFFAMRNVLLWNNTTDGINNAGNLPDSDQLRANLRIENFDPPSVDVAFTTVRGLYDSGVSHYIGNANSDENPLFESEASGNLRLQDASPVIDFGVNAVDIDLSTLGFQPLPATDFEGNPRIVEGDGFGIAVVDRGAYEYQP